MADLDSLDSSDSGDVDGGDFAPGPAVGYLYLASGTVEAWNLDPKVRARVRRAVVEVREATGDAIEVRALGDGALLYRADA